MADSALTHLEEIFRTNYGAVYQCNRYNCYWLSFAGGLSSFKVTDFFRFKQQLEAIDVAEMVQNPARTADIAILMPFRSERCFVLTITDVLNLRELLRGTKFMLELNSILHECFHGMAV